MHRLLLLAAAPLLVSAADPVAVARAEAAAAEREVRKLEAVAAEARGEAERLAAEQAAAGAAILAAEASLSAAEEQSRRLGRQLAAYREQLAEGQRPAALLLAGVAQMGRRPPLLALADGASPREFVIARALVDTSLPAMRARTAALRAQAERGERLAAAAAAAQADLVRRGQDLRTRQLRLAQLEARANARSLALGSEALAAGDIALSRAATASDATSLAAREASARRLASQLAALPEASPRPLQAQGSPVPPGLNWRMPVAGAVLVGLHEVSPSGVRAHGLTVRAPRGTPVLAPAPGRIVFSGPFRRHAGVLIIDHGEGWMTLLTEVRSDLVVGTRVRQGDPVGRTLGPPTVELTRNGKPQDAALIARSSAALSKSGRNG